MKRRDFSQVCGVAMAASAGLSLPALAQMKPPVSGKDYQVLDKPAAVEAPKGKIEVIEFFWYNCPHCNTFEPALAAWIKRASKDVVVRRVPVSFRDDFLPQQRLFYTLEAMGLLDKLHGKVFAAIHAEKLSLGKQDEILAWVVKQGVDKTKFATQFNSFAVATKASRGTQLQNAYKVEGVPAMGVAGRFYVDGTMAGSMDRALQIVDSLVAQVRTGR